MPTETRSSNKQVESANNRMRQAWQRGRKEIEARDRRRKDGKTRRAPSDDASMAEKLRKYRSVATVISEDELESICSLCMTHGKKWGPTFLVEIARVDRKKDRNNLVRQAITNRWGLIQLKRHVRLLVGVTDRCDGHATRVGRKRTIDWSDELIVLDEISSQLNSWLYFAKDFEAARDDHTATNRIAAGVKEVTETAETLRLRCLRRLKHIRSQQD